MGLPRVPPGSHFSYDSNRYIQYLSYVLRAVTKEEPVAWATKHFAVPLGIPKLFATDGKPGATGPLYGKGDICAGGGQLYTCRQIARVGQLLVAGGVWSGPDGKPFQLIAKAYVDQMFKPSFPRANAAYGFLTWLNTPVGGDHCCAPRWGDGTQPICAASAAAPKDCTLCCKPEGGEPEAGTLWCNTTSRNLDSSVADLAHGDKSVVRVGSSYINQVSNFCCLRWKIRVLLECVPFFSLSERYLASANVCCHRA